MNPAWNGTLEQYLVGPRVNFINNVITELPEEATVALKTRSLVKQIETDSVPDYDMHKRGIFRVYVEGDVQHIMNREMTHSVKSGAK